MMIAFSQFFLAGTVWLLVKSGITSTCTILLSAAVPRAFGDTFALLAWPADVVLDAQAFTLDVLFVVGRLAFRSTCSVC